MSFQLRRGGVVGGASLGVVAVVAASAALASAQVPGLPLTIAPGSGPTDTSISVSGDGCLGQEVALRLLEGSDTLDLTSAPRGTEGDWTGTLAVPDDDDDLFGAQLTITADCLGGDADYEPGSFSVDDPTPPTTTTSTTSTTTSTTTSPTTTAPQSPGPSPTPSPTPTPPATTPPVTTPPPPPADPVAAEPDFAG
ncbi:MAG TPA: hypothetical protein VK611_01845 [Acidimicrobiales bacterium]|nr:hypothetical protein [Acidimicrobiales bacterium]